MKILEKDTLEAIMPGTTHRLDMGNVEAIIFYEDAEKAHMLLPDGKAYSGKWELRERGYSVDWTNGPSATWQLGRADGSIHYLDVEGSPRARVTAIEYANTAGLPKT
ncbi:MAG: hypothetical protein JJ913_13355 [Rhizobiaceae bacterium]|nr:hypothetical protein [Rhizobiaceae bacterium]